MIAIDVHEQTSTRVLDDFSGQLVHTAGDASTISSISEIRGAERVLAQTSTKVEAGRYSLTSSAEFGTEVDLVNGSELVVADCALA